MGSCSSRCNFIAISAMSVLLQLLILSTGFINFFKTSIFPQGKAFEITYVRLKFYSSRPESFAIYKRTDENGPWQPYQYYSASCRKTYERDNKGFIRPGDNERTAHCTDEFSDISPLTGGNVAFSTLEGRPSAYNFDQSPVLQVWQILMWFHINVWFGRCVVSVGTNSVILTIIIV